MKAFNVKAEPANAVFQVKQGESLFQAMRRAGVEISASCGGKGRCGKCKVRVLAGDCGEPSGEENALLGWLERESGLRLACMAYPRSDMKIFVPEGEGGHFDKKDMNRFPADFRPGRTVMKLVLHVPPATLEDQRSSAGRMLAALEQATGRRAEEYRVELSCLAGLEKALLAGNGVVTAVLEGRRVLEAEPGDTSDKCFGVAFDIGTTTVVGLLWDLIRGGLLGAAARTNPQTSFGADVISRINYAGGSEQQLAEISGKIRDCLEEIKNELCREAGILPRQIYRAAVVGNTTMSHLFLGIDPSPLARAPFAPVFCRAEAFRAGELGLGVHPAAALRILPNIAGHVGSDISAVLLATRLFRRKGVHMAVDIGTNGEILLASDGKVLACSTAAGPAFEGAEIHQGMRAAPGAISGMSVNGEGLTLKVVGGSVPVGICGSGLIEAVAQLLDAGAVDGGGRLLRREEAREKGLAELVCRRLRGRGEPGGFVLYSAEEDGGGEGEDIVLTQMDIRKVQLAKGAIAAGIRVMAKEAGIALSQLETVSLAGAFGNFVSIESVLRIGLLPRELETEQVIPVGNAAGAGASMALLSDTEFADVCRWAAQAVHVELSSHPDFQNEFIEAMSF